MPKVQDKAMREERIIVATFDLMEESSFLSLRMSDIANKAGCSMGTVYSHFSSKEDLLLACANHIQRLRIPLKTRIMELSLPAHEKLVLLCFTMWVFDDKYSHYIPVEQLALNPLIWERSSSHRHNLSNTVAAEIGLFIKQLSQQLLQEHPTLEYTDELAQEFAWDQLSKSVGFHTIKQAAFETFTASSADEQYKRLMMRFLYSWSIQPQNPEQLIDSLFKQATLIVDQVLASPGCITNRSDTDQR